jgi:hypothetical protein
MEAVNQKYQNFHKWIGVEIAGLVANPFMLSLLASVPLETFLREIP